ncbi:hypothetical protein JW766_00235 [Candidatus Dojkabacteria bacterium]|nr:hypothetical protein [Candidatus Dojkabacteria bacterium]
MKKLILYFLTSISAIWLVDLLVSGFTFNGGAITVFLVILFIVVGIYLAEWVITKAGKKSSMLLFFVIGLFITFFSLYFASLFLQDFNVGAGSLQGLKIGFLSTPVIKGMDQILSLLIGSLIVMLVATVTRWAQKGSSAGKE